MARKGWTGNKLEELVAALTEIAELMEEQDRAFGYSNAMPFQSREVARVAQRALASVRGEED